MSEYNGLSDEEIKSLSDDVVEKANKGNIDKEEKNYDIFTKREVLTLKEKILGEKPYHFIDKTYKDCHDKIYCVPGDGKGTHFHGGVFVPGGRALINEEYGKLDNSRLVLLSRKYKTFRALIFSVLWANGLRSKTKALFGLGKTKLSRVLRALNTDDEFGY